MDETDIKLKLRKNRLEMEHKDKMQIRNALLLALVGIPLTIFNLVISAGYDKLYGFVAAFIIAFFLWRFVEQQNKNLEKIRRKINRLENQLLKEKVKEKK